MTLIVVQRGRVRRISSAFSLLEIEAAPVVVVNTIRGLIPELCWQGLGEKYITFNGVRSFDTDRAAMTTQRCIDQFVRAAQWLDQAPRRVGINKRTGSYGWKHVAERFHQGLDEEAACYVSNGMCIAAAFAMGLLVEQRGDGPNAWFNLSARARPKQP